MSLIALVYLCCVGYSYSQVRIGATLGGNSSYLIGDTPPNASFISETGYSVGLNSDFFLLEDVSILLQAFYSKKNSSLQYEVDYQYEAYDSLNFSFEYLEIPLSVKVTADNNIAYVTAGFSLNLALSAKTVRKPAETETDIIDSFEPLSLSANFGVGVQFYVGKPLLFCEFRYTQGISNLMSSTSNETENISRMKINSMQLLAGIMFNL